jgi:hypothetical protein
MINVAMQTDRQAGGISKITFLHLIWLNTHKSTKISNRFLSSTLYFFIYTPALMRASKNYARKQTRWSTQKCETRKSGKHEEEEEKTAAAMAAMMIIMMTMTMIKGTAKGKKKKKMFEKINKMKYPLLRRESRL